MIYRKLDIVILIEGDKYHIYYNVKANSKRGGPSKTDHKSNANNQWNE